MPGTTGIPRELLCNSVLKKLSARRMVGLIRSQYRSIFFLLMFIAVYSILMSWFTIQRYRSFQAGFYDLGIFNHDFWVRIFDFERISGLQSLIFGGHVAPSLYLLLPFYAIHPCCETLLVLQTVILALAVIPLYAIASETLSSRRLGLAFSAVYLLYPPLHWVNRADFHAQALIPLMFLSMFYSYRRGNLAYAVFLSLTAFTIEFAPLLVIFFGVYALAREFLSSGKSEFSRVALSLPLTSIVAGLMILVFEFFLVSKLQASYPPMHCQIFGFERALPLQVVRSGAGTAMSFDIFLRPMTIVDLVGIDYS